MTLLYLDSCQAYGTTPLSGTNLELLYRIQEFGGSGIYAHTIETSTPRTPGSQYIRIPDTILGIQLSITFSIYPTIQYPNDPLEKSICHLSVGEDYTVGIAFRMESPAELLSMRFVSAAYSSAGDARVDIFTNGDIEFYNENNDLISASVMTTPISVGQWLYLEIKFKAGVSGYMEVYVDDALAAPRANGDFSVFNSDTEYFIGFELLDDVYDLTAFSFTDIYLIKEDGVGLTGLQTSAAIFGYALLDTDKARVTNLNEFSVGDEGGSDALEFSVTLQGSITGTPIELYTVQATSSVSTNTLYSADWNLKDPAGTRSMATTPTSTSDLYAFVGTEYFGKQSDASDWTITDLNNTTVELVLHYVQA